MNEATDLKENKDGKNSMLRLLFLFSHLCLEIKVTGSVCVNRFVCATFMLIQLLSVSETLCLTPPMIRNFL